jgi:hypothetical protein
MAYLTNAFKYRALYNSLNGKTCKLAFYTSGISDTTAAYTATNEVTDTTVVPAGGVTLASLTFSASDGSVATAYADWADVTVTPSATFAFRYVLIYNDTDTPKNTIFWHDFGSTQTWNASTQYTLTIPSSGSGLCRIS